MIIPARELMPLVLAALESDQHVRMTVTGSSMYPFIRGGEVVELEPVHTLPAAGDIVLAKRSSMPESTRYVLHRIVRAEGGLFFLRGDSQKDCEGPFTRGDILGKATLVFRKGRAHRLDYGIWRRAGFAWNRCAPLNLWLFQLTRQFQGKRK
ncbi:MAG: S24/S26 family peptidase [Syntrophobacteraceae bacterium]